MIRVNNRLAFAAEPSVTLGEPSGELTLRIKHGQDCSREVRVTSSKCSIGASAGCTIELREPGVQPVHCVILRGAGKTVVRRWAPNAWLNGQHFVDAVLNSGDELRIAGVTIQVFFASESFSAFRPDARCGASFHAAVGNQGDSTTLNQLVQRLQDAEQRVHQLQAEVVQNRQDAASIVEQIKRVERFVRSDSAKKFQKVLDGLHQEKESLGQRLAALELRHQEERSAWQLELDSLAAELARQSEKNKLEEDKCHARAERIAELELNSRRAQPERIADHERQLAHAKQQLDEHQAELTHVQAELELQQRMHLAQAKAFEEALSHTQKDLQLARDQLESKQHEVLTQQQTQDELKSAHADQISQLEAALQQNIEKHERLSVQLELQRAAEQETISRRDGQVDDLEKQLRLRDTQCNQLADQLEQARQAAKHSGELQSRVDQLDVELQRFVDEKAALQAELDWLRARELPGLQQQIVQLTDELQAARVECAQLQAQIAATATSNDLQHSQGDEIASLVEQRNQSQAIARELTANLETLNAERTQLQQQINRLEVMLSERSDVCDQLRASLAGVEAGNSAQSAELVARVAELESELQQQLGQRQALQAELRTLQQDQDDARDARVLELQRALDACQQERESLRDELNRCQASTASQVVAEQQRQAALLEERNQLAARCTALEAECTQLQQNRQVEHDAALDREHHNQLAQSRLDQQMAQMQSDFEIRQSTWRDRESNLRQTIEDLKSQVGELLAATDNGLKANTFARLEPQPSKPEEHAAIGQMTADVSDFSATIEADWFDQAAADPPTCAVPAAEASFSGADTNERFDAPVANFRPSDDADLFAAEGDPFADALNAMEVSIHELQSETTGAGNAEWRDQEAAADVVGPVFDDAQNDERASIDASIEEGTEEPLNEAESQLLARIRALTGESTASHDARVAAVGQDDSDDERRDAPTTSHGPHLDQEADDEETSLQNERDRENASHELTIEDYMQRLLNRVGNSSSGSPPVAEKTQTVVMGESELSSPHRIETKKSSNPLSSSSNRERTARPLTSVEMGAMRELANESTRTALSSHAKRSQEKAALSTLGTAIILLLASAILFILSRGELSLFLLAGVATLAATFYFGYRALHGGAARFLFAAKKQKPAKAGDASQANLADRDPSLAGQDMAVDLHAPTADAHEANLAG